MEEDCLHLTILLLLRVLYRVSHARYTAYTYSSLVLFRHLFSHAQDEFEVVSCILLSKRFLFEMAN